MTNIYETANVSSGDITGDSGKNESRGIQKIRVSCSAGTFVGEVKSSDMHGNTLLVKQFLGIPYARPPIGNLRFKKSRSKRTLKKPYDATTPKLACMDLGILFSGKVLHWDDKTSEDCLYLNLYVPVVTDPDRTLPVIVFIHETQISVSEIARLTAGLGQVVFVHVNFRMNVWGFLNTHDGVIPGNMGLWDQHMAIRWVHNNIEPFGGDPGQVTLLGYYEGASNVIYQAMFPSNAGMFKRIIVNCGQVRCPWVFDAAPDLTAERFSAVVGCHNRTSRERLQCLRSLTTEEIVGRSFKGWRCLQFPSETVTSVDDAFLRFPPYTLLNPDSDLDLPELNAFSEYDILTSVIELGGSMLIKVPGDIDWVPEPTNNRDSANKTDVTLDEYTNVTYNDIIETNDTVEYDYLYTNDTVNVKKYTSKFNSPVWEINRVMFGLEFDNNARQQLTEDFKHLSCNTWTRSCFVTSLPRGGSIFHMTQSCIAYSNGTITTEEEYSRFYGEETPLPSPILVLDGKLTDFETILVHAKGFEWDGWVFKGDEIFTGDSSERLKVAVDIWTTFAKSGALSSVVALGANIICNKIPGLAPRQRAICRSRPVAIAVIGGGARLGLNECQYQFRNMRWNCTMASKYDSMFGYQHDIASKEAAVWSAMSSSGVVYAITQACSLGSLKECGCDKSKTNYVYDRERSFSWGGCSADIRYGLKLARKFLDAREIEETARSLMNRHNNKVGRKAVRDNMRLECRCHGPTGSCTVKTCWRRLPSFREVGDFLLKQYQKSKQVVPWRGSRLLRPNALVLKKSNRPNKKPRRRDLVYLELSPNFCEYNLTTGSLGTVGRKCNKGSKWNDGCTLMCCGRGYNTHQYTRTWQCNCTFHWCCVVNCKNCTEKRLEYTCK